MTVAENEDLQRAVQAIVRRELVLSEERVEARMTAVVDDLRSEIRSLRKVDEALDSRLTITMGRVDSMAHLNQEMIAAGVKQALGDMFSPKRVVAFIGILLGVISGAVALVDQTSALF